MSVDSASSASASSASASSVSVDILSEGTPSVAPPSVATSQSFVSLTDDSSVPSVIGGNMSPVSLLSTEIGKASRRSSRLAKTVFSPDDGTDIVEKMSDMSLNSKGKHKAKVIAVGGDPYYVNGDGDVFSLVPFGKVTDTNTITTLDGTEVRF